MQWNSKKMIAYQTISHLIIRYIKKIFLRVKIISFEHA